MLRKILKQRSHRLYQALSPRRRIVFYLQKRENSHCQPEEWARKNRQMIHTILFRQTNGQSRASIQPDLLWRIRLDVLQGQRWKKFFRFPSGFCCIALMNRNPLGEGSHFCETGRWDSNAYKANFIDLSAWQNWRCCRDLRAEVARQMANKATNSQHNVLFNKGQNQNTAHIKSHLKLEAVPFQLRKRKKKINEKVFSVDCWSSRTHEQQPLFGEAIWGIVVWYGDKEVSKMLPPKRLLQFF